ncbi:Uncharacterised protein [Escherichia coli]|nr:Uncharacterised protein [Escherichia coli]GCO50395.1 hypothetical protein BvCms235_01556 [Escherichia coli]GDC99494.1 hypothetical protein HmCmsJML233_04243 [Escherichia coli]GDJ81827.1 hypothetical protein BvCmsKSNP049_01797 [Escherichia coli]GDQ85280.1 hypothetical protein BvCmsNSP045_03672 [Escherichia coli]
MVLQRRPRSLPSWHRLWLFAVQFTCHHLPFPVQVRLRMPRQHNSSSRPYLRRATHSPRGFCIVSPAVHLPAGKVLPVGTLETSGVVIHFILRALVILVLAFLIKTPCPAGSFKGVVLGHHGRRADLCTVAELADAEGAHLGTGVRIPGDLKGLRQITHGVAQDQALVGTFLRVLLIKEDAFLRRHPAQEIVIGFAVLDTKLTGRMRLAEQRTPLGHTVFLQDRSEDAFDVLILEDTEVLAQPCAPQRRAHLHAVQHLVFVVLPQFKPGHHTFHPALYVIALPYRQVGHFVQHLRKFKGKKLLTDQRKVEGKK